jgi:aminoglycoside/choline kinase family phosphotransferase
VNAHHLPEMVRSWAASRGIETVQYEETLLDSGGALGEAFAAGRIVSDHVLVHNGDILHDFDLEEFWRKHLESDADISLLVLDHPRINTVLVREGRFVGVWGHRLCPEETDGCARRTFSGVALYRTGILAGTPRTPWTVKDLWHRSDLDVRVQEVGAGRSWADCGTPQDLAHEIFAELARQNLSHWSAPGADVDSTASIGRETVVEADAHVGANAHLERALLLPGAKVAPGEILSGVLRNAGGEVALGQEVAPELSPTTCAKLTELGHRAPYRATIAGSAGSGRRYWRIGTAPESLIVLFSPPTDLDYDRFLEVSQALREAGLRVPRIYGRDDTARQVVMEDLGSGLHLDRMRRRADRPLEQLELCRGVLTALGHWQKLGTAAMPSCPWLCDRRFDEAALRWETEYFTHRYLGDVCGVDAAKNAALMAEFDALAARVAAHPQVLMHRDFQSQNLMWRDGEVWFIDYQGARSGSMWYDLASFLWDPYVRLADELREVLLQEFIATTAVPPETAQEEFLEASLQRLMQALGAYGFLSLQKGLPWFRKFWEPGRELLEKCLALHGGLPALQDVLEQTKVP